MAEKALLKGNEAIAESAIRAGCRHFFGYPITPQTELAAYMAKRMPKVGGTFLQAESEIAAVNMVIGAAAAGKRTMTSSSSPGIALKSEGISYLIGCDLPAVIVNIQRGGPGLGGIQPSQADYNLATKGAGHGDAHLCVLAPCNIQEMVDLTARAFDLADRYRMPVMILGDGALGQMMEPVVFKDGDDPNTAVSGTEIKKPWAVGQKNGRQIVNSLYIEPEDLERLNIERFKKYEQIEKNETLYEEYLTEDADIVLVAYGIAARISKTVVNMARGLGIKAGLFRPVSLWPFPSKELMKLADKAKHFVSVELSMGQMIHDVRLAIACKRPVDFCGRTGGMLPSPSEVLEKLKSIHENMNREQEV